MQVRAGIMKLAALAESDDALFDSQVAVNLKGTFNTLRQAAKRLRSGGRIVNLSTSVVGLEAGNLWGLRGHQGSSGDHDRDPVEGAARPFHHGQRRGARADGHGAFPQRQVRNSSLCSSHSPITRN